MKVNFRVDAFIDGVRYRRGVQDYTGDPVKLPRVNREELKVGEKETSAAPSTKDTGKSKDKTDDPLFTESKK